MTRSVEIPDEALNAALVAAGSTLLHGDRAAQMRAALEAALPYLASAGDGGLREALEKVASEIDTGSRATVNREAKGWQERTARRLRDLLKAHPAVPQPAKMQASDGEPKSLTVHLTGPGAAFVSGTAFPSGVAYPAVLQPVDREALVKALRACTCTSLPRPTCPSHGDEYARADAVLAVLAGEQEQVEK